MLSQHYTVQTFLLVLLWLPYTETGGGSGPLVYLFRTKRGIGGNASGFDGVGGAWA